MTTKYKKGDKVRLLTDNKSRCMHQKEDKPSKRGDITVIDSYDGFENALIYSSSEFGKQYIWLFLDSVELVTEDSSDTKECTCDMRTLNMSGCVCGSIIRYKDKK